MSSIGSVASAPIARVSDGDADEASVSVAASAIAQAQRDGANTVALIQSAVAPPTGDHRGASLNVMA